MTLHSFSLKKGKGRLRNIQVWEMFLRLEIDIFSIGGPGVWFGRRWQLVHFIFEFEVCKLVSFKNVDIIFGH